MLHRGREDSFQGLEKTIRGLHDFHFALALKGEHDEVGKRRIGKLTTKLQFLIAEAGIIQPACGLYGWMMRGIGLNNHLSGFLSAAGTAGNLSQ
jgi:hypothetical protein